MTDDTIHTCSYYCERPECVRRQRDELRDRMESVLAKQPPSAPVGVDFAAVASILRRAMRDGVHYGYRRDFILQQALALEALSQQPAAVGGADAQAAEIEALRAEVDEWKRVAAAQAELHGEAEARADKLRAEVERLRADRDSWEQQASDRVADWHAEHLRAERLTEALRKLEERKQSDEALLRQALEALERGAWDTLSGRNAAFAIRERLGLEQEE